MDAEEDLGTMAWPGFVDILSSVIIMFVFFVMVVASALYFHIIIFKSKILSEISDLTSASANAQELADTNRFLMEKVEDLEEKLKVLEKPSDENSVQLYQVHTQFAESNDQNIREEEDSVVIFFGSTSISVTEESTSRVKDIIERYKEEHSAENIKVRIIAGKDPTSLTDAISRQLAVSRMLNVRNLFVDTEIPMHQVKPTVAGSEEIDGQHNWVRVVFERK
ncbi:MAG: hypothetical protein ACRBDL_10120 [Alphaproteobacteria bacterium]